MNLKTAIAHIEKHGALLVFPIKNTREPLSLWSCFFPRSKMKWEWDEDGDNRVADLWHLREQLSSSGKVIYTKWFQGRATVFSKSLFVPLMAALNHGNRDEAGRMLGLSHSAEKMLRILTDNSPISTKALKRELNLAGKENERQYNRSLKELWQRLLIVGYGEVDEGAFPSLALGSTRSLFEEEFRKAARMSVAESVKEITSILSKTSPFFRFFIKIESSVQARPKAKIPAERKSPPKEIRWEHL